MPAPFAAPAGERIGEIWFEPALPVAGLLAKYLFTSEKLSVQVHPSDAQAPAGMRGKEECWLVLDAEPGASLAIGFDQPIGPEAMRAAALDGSIEQLLTWHKVQRGDVFYLPAGTVHAIGPGLALVEIQQNSDITYRLYDYGRPRELHLDAALAVAQGAPYDPALRGHVDFTRSQRLVSGPKFTIDLVVGTAKPDVPGPCLVMPLEGKATIDGSELEAGECAAVASLSGVQFAPAGCALVAAELG
nr:class I mannose-6-phosphate isomerase [Parerythrobacter lacustris]